MSRLADGPLVKLLLVLLPFFGIHRELSQKVLGWVHVAKTLCGRHAQLFSPQRN